MAIKNLCFAALVFGFFIVPLQPSFSQDTAPSNIPSGSLNPADMQDGAYTDEIITAYAIATLKIQQIQLNIMPEMETAADVGIQRQLMQDMQERMGTAIEQTEGMTIDLYNKIATEARTDTDLTQRIEAALELNADADLSLDLFKGLATDKAKTGT